MVDQADSRRGHSVDVGNGNGGGESPSGHVAFSILLFCGAALVAFEPLGLLRVFGHYGMLAACALSLLCGGVSAVLAILGIREFERTESPQWLKEGVQVFASCPLLIEDGFLACR
jgi:hypothetical protein